MTKSPDILSLTIIIVIAGQILAVACLTHSVPYQTYDNSMNRAVANCLDNQLVLTGIEATGAGLAMAAGGQGLGTLGLKGAAETTLTVTAAISGLAAAVMGAVALGIQSRMKLKSCREIMDRYHDRIDFEIQLKKKDGPEPKWWPAAQEAHEGKPRR